MGGASGEAGAGLHRLHGGRQVDRSRRGPRGRAADDRDRRPDGKGVRQADPPRLRRGRGGGVPQSRGRGRWRAAGAGGRRRDRARRRQRALRARPRGARAPCGRLAAGRCPRGLAADCPQRPPAGQQRRGRRAPARGAAAVLRASGRCGDPARGPRPDLPRDAVADGSRRAAGRDEDALGYQRLG